jgi:antirestriction protein ArdC
VTGDLLTRKAKELTLIPELEVSKGFVCSSGWLSNFKKRYSISSHVRHGEAGSAPADSVEFAKNKLRELLSFHV